MKNIVKNKNILLIFSMITILYGCETHIQDDIVAIDEEEESCDPDISFSADVKPIIDANCISCHGGNQAPNLSTFNGISINADRVKTQVVSRRMPLGGSLTQEEIEFIKCWIENGALNN